MLVKTMNNFYKHFKSHYKIIIYQNINLLFRPILLLSLLSGCTFLNNSSKNRNQSDNKYFNGDLVTKINEIYSKENEDMYDSCDYKNKEKIFEIVLEINKKDDLIKKTFQEKSPELPTIKIGKYTFLNYKNDKDPTNEWKTSQDSWNDIIAFYENAKKSDDPVSWARLNRWVRSIISDDEDRIKYGIFYGSTRNSEPILLKIKEKIEICLKNSECINIGFSIDEFTFLSKGRLYSRFLFLLNDKEYPINKKRNLIQKFLNWIDSDLDRYKFNINPIAKIEDKTLVIPIDISVFEADEASFIDIIETAWNLSAGNKIKLLSQKRPAPSFLLNIDDMPGGRAFVQFKNQSIQLFNFGRIKTMIHEFGHVLGLRDEYYTHWDLSTCSYIDEYNEANIMSGSSTGVVLPEHWEKLNLNYWK